jgi:hypothetical protein
MWCIPYIDWWWEYPTTYMPHIHQFNEENDQNMSEIQSKSIWYNKILIQKCIWLYLGQFLTVFDDPGIEFTALYVGTWYNIRSHDKTGLLRFYDNFQKRKTANWTAKDQSINRPLVRSFPVQFSPVSVFFSVLWTGPSNTSPDTWCSGVLSAPCWFGAVLGQPDCALSVMQGRQCSLQLPLKRATLRQQFPFQTCTQSS